MSARFRVLSRVPRVLVVATVLVVAGAGVAAAYWTATTQLTATTSAATLGLEQDLLPTVEGSPLHATYTSETPAAAGAVSLTNTGSRPAEYTFTVEGDSASDQGLLDALQITAAPRAGGSVCAAEDASAAPADPAGSVAGHLPLTFTGSVEAGQSVELCVRTALAAADIDAFAEQQLTLAISTVARYADGEAWTVSAEPVIIAQTVGPHEPSEPGQPIDPEEPGAPIDPEQPGPPGEPGGGDFRSDAARYHLSLDGACIQLTNVDALRGIALHASCGQWESQWRLTDAGDGSFHIDWANNETPGALQQTRWTAAGAGKSVTLLDPVAGSDAQRWRITARSETQYRFESVAHPGQYLTVGEGLWNPTDPSPRRLTLEPAGEDAAQSIGFERIGTPFRAVEQMTGSGDAPWYLQLSFPANTGYEKEISYRVLLAHESTPDARVAYPAGALEGAYPTVQFHRDSGLLAYVDSAEGAYGNTWVHVEQKLPGGDWTPAAVGTIHITPPTSQDPNALGVHNGWQE